MSQMVRNIVPYMAISFLCPLSYQSKRLETAFHEITWLFAWSQAEYRIQKTEYGRQETELRRQKTEFDHRASSIQNRESVLIRGYLLLNYQCQSCLIFFRAFCAFSWLKHRDRHQSSDG